MSAPCFLSVLIVNVHEDEQFLMKNSKIFRDFLNVQAWKMWNETPPKNSNIYRLGHCCVFPFTKWYAGACLIVRHRVAIVSERRNHSERLQCSLNLIPSRSTNKIKQRTNSTSNARNVSQESLENQNQLRSTAKNYQRRSNFENQKTAQNFCSRICGQLHQTVW
jgi:hypothetical protein